MKRTQVYRIIIKASTKLALQKPSWVEFWKQENWSGKRTKTHDQEELIGHQVVKLKLSREKLNAKPSMMRTWTATRNEYTAIIVLNNDNDGHGTGFSLDFTTDFVVYAIIAILVMVIALILKLMRNIDQDDIRAVGGRHVMSSTENNRLLSSSSDEGTLFSCSSYGTINNSDEEDLLESGKLRNCCSSSSEDLYDAKICVICYDHQRNCFFVPCGHCISCIPCAKRIISGEIKSCPICRTFINKVAKLRIL
ncbi:RING/U-box superfamily protein [Striga asiatica]|uniref:RING/U-box superfamily protein n=1 Tax=Striga asiatica TaxID=4170 RepID=A0A5A7PDS3_STRAF|nr:RING/U-box superfamily protein [Striga asiatica]